MQLLSILFGAGMFLLVFGLLGFIIYNETRQPDPPKPQSRRKRHTKTKRSR